MADNKNVGHTFISRLEALMSIFIPRRTKVHYSINNEDRFIESKPLTKRWIKGFDAAKKASQYDDSETQSHRMGSAIFQSGKLLSTGHNVYGKSKPGNTFADDLKVYNKSVHAEQMAVDRIKHYEYDAKLVLYVVRLDGNGDFTCSSPCDMCIEYMKEHGIKKVRFINKNGQPEELTL